jgi:carbon monoxide dehydrogenase subunit G
MIEIEEHMRLATDPGSAWRQISDPRGVVSCIPGAELLEENEDGSFDGRVQVAFGPMRVSFAGTVQITLDHDNRVGEIVGTATDRQGATRLQAKAKFAVLPADNELETVVQLLCEIQLAGKLAGQIESGASAVTRRLTGEFMDCFSGRLGGEELLAVSGHESRSGLRALLRRVLRWFSRDKLIGGNPDDGSPDQTSMPK